jgi:NAD-specific glutamate dehydrogenase
MQSSSFTLTHTPTHIVLSVVFNYASQATIKLRFLLSIEMFRNLVRIKTGKILYLKGGQVKFSAKLPIIELIGNGNCADRAWDLHWKENRHFVNVGDGKVSLQKQSQWTKSNQNKILQENIVLPHF